MNPSYNQTAQAGASPAFSFSPASEVHRPELFSGDESWLKIPVAALKMSDLPRDYWPAIIVLALRQMPYEEYLETTHWSAVRLRAINRYRGQCLCGKDAVDAHHINYDRKGFEHPEDVVALCRPCHTLWHETWVLQAKAGLEAA